VKTHEALELARQKGEDAVQAAQRASPDDLQRSVLDLALAVELLIQVVEADLSGAAGRGPADRLNEDLLDFDAGVR
jgi:hypothetical protein